MGGRAAAEGPTGLAHTLLSGSCRGPASAQCSQEPRTWLWTPGSQLGQRPAV